MPKSNGTSPKKLADFNAFRKEYRKGALPIVIEIGEARLEFPTQMPAAVMLDLMAFMEDAGEDADLREIPLPLALSIMNTLLGGEELKRITREYNLDINEMLWILEQLMGHYMGQMPESDQGNATKTASMSSTTGG